MQISRSDVKSAPRGGGRARNVNPFAKAEFVSIMPEGISAGNFVLVKIHSDDFGSKLVLWDGENANFFNGIELAEFARGVTESRPFSRTLWKVVTLGTFDDEKSFMVWMEKNHK